MTLSPSFVTRSAARHSSSTIRPTWSPTFTQSPIWIVRSMGSARPAKTLAIVFWSARPTTAVTTADVVSSEKGSTPLERSTTRTIPKSMTACARSRRIDGIWRRRRAKSKTTIAQSPVSPRARKRIVSSASAPDGVPSSAAITLASRCRTSAIARNTAGAVVPRRRSGGSTAQRSRSTTASARIPTRSSSPEPWICWSRSHPLIGGGVYQAAGARTKAPGCPSGACGPGAGLPEGARERVERPLRLRVREDERRGQADHGVTVERPVEDEPRLERARREARARGRVRELEADEQAAAAHADEPAAPDERAASGEERPAERAGAGRQALAHEDLERGEARGARHGMAPERGDVRERRVVRERGHHLAPPDEGAERQPAAERLREDEEGRDDAGVLVGEEVPRAPEPRHHLVEDEERARLVAAAAQRREELRARDPHARLRLDRLDDDGGGPLVDRGEPGRIVEGEERHAGEERLERRAVHRVAADREGAERVAVEAAVERHQAGAPGVLARRLERALDRLGAARREIDHVERGGERGEPLREPDLRLLDELAVHHHVEVSLRLRAHRGHHLGVRVADVRDAHAGEEIEIRAAARVPHRRARRARDRDAERRRRRLADVAEEARAEVRHGSTSRSGGPLRPRSAPSGAACPQGHVSRGICMRP